MNQPFHFRLFVWNSILEELPGEAESLCNFRPQIDSCLKRLIRPSFVLLDHNIDFQFLICLITCQCSQRWFEEFYSCSLYHYTFVLYSLSCVLTSGNTSPFQYYGFWALLYTFLQTSLRPPVHLPHTPQASFSANLNRHTPECLSEHISFTAEALPFLSFPFPKGLADNNVRPTTSRRLSA